MHRLRFGIGQHQDLAAQGIALEGGRGTAWCFDQTVLLMRIGHIEPLGERGKVAVAEPAVTDIL